MVTCMETDYVRVAQAVLVRALHEAEHGPGKGAARYWLVCSKNRQRELILTVTNLHQDDLNRFVKELA